MPHVVSFEGYRPAARHDGIPWTEARVQEAPTPDGPWVTIDTIALTPDVNPETPQLRNLTTANASDAGLWYRIVFADINDDIGPSLPVRNTPPETLAETALCTDEDVRMYLNIKGIDLTDDDQNTLVRLANAASETFTDESQRLWIVPDSENPQTRRYLVETADLTRGWLRIEDARSITSVTYGNPRDYATPFATLAPSTGWYAATPDPGQPLLRLGFFVGVPFPAGWEVLVTGQFGWANSRDGIPQKVRQAVIYTAAEWYARDVENFSGTFSVDEGRILLPRVLPDQVQALAESYRRWRVA